MYYEIYADSVFLLYFLLYLYVLLLVNKLSGEMVKWRRLVVGACIGAFCTLLPLLVPIQMFGGGIGYAISLILMGCYTFRIHNRKQLLQIMEKLLIIMLILGGFVSVLLKTLPVAKGGLWGLGSVVFLGALCYWGIDGRIERKRQNRTFCKVRLLKKQGALELNALMDTGNTLVEPISGKPVAVVGEGVIKEYYGGAVPEIYRIIPFHSVGKRKGVLQGYQLEKMVIETANGQKLCENIFVAVSKELLTEGKGYEMILNPEILKW